ncbi:hypothetical protein Pla52n_35980 [Stieleria varia]|uniref:Uncharacterized protein n=1 Tax=Stieleria varia TaxID=2528005 RepID=A0A5C6ASN5_9BACT|nr:hypothetical protein Pla52n_35980 [Stieleria varia]
MTKYVLRNSDVTESFSRSRSIKLEVGRTVELKQHALAEQAISGTSTLKQWVFLLLHAQDYDAETLRRRLQQFLREEPSDFHSNTSYSGTYNRLSASSTPGHRKISRGDCWKPVISRRCVWKYTSEASKTLDKWQANSAPSSIALAHQLQYPLKWTGASQLILSDAERVTSSTIPDICRGCGGRPIAVHSNRHRRASR